MKNLNFLKLNFVLNSSLNIVIWYSKHCQTNKSLNYCSSTRRVTISICNGYYKILIYEILNSISTLLVIAKFSFHYYIIVHLNKCVTCMNRVIYQ